MPIERRQILAAIAAAVVLPLGAHAEPDSPSLHVYKDPNCGCCSAWADHMRRNGFRVTTQDAGDLDSIKRKHRVPAALGSCHTATVAGYTIEGHVPADAVRRLLKERPKGIVGLAVPGMPLGSPGMESPTPQRYDIVAFDAKGTTRVFERR